MNEQQIKILETLTESVGRLIDLVTELNKTVIALHGRVDRLERKNVKYKRPMLDKFDIGK